MLNTDELSGAELDLYVARAEAMRSEDAATYYGYAWIAPDGACYLQPATFGELHRKSRFAPSVDWSQGGPILERESMKVEKDLDGYSEPREPWCAEHGVFWSIGPTCLIAAMRAYVRAAFGDEVPDPRA